MWSLTYTVGLPLLRNEEIVQRDPPEPPLSSFMPLDPVRDLYIPSFMSGEADPVRTVLEQTAHPLVFYAVDAPVTIRLSAPYDAYIWFTF